MAAPSGLVNITSDDPGLAEFLSEQPLRATSAASNSEFRLADGINRLPPGKYLLRAESPTMELPFTNLEVRAGEPIELRIKLPAQKSAFPWQYARIPRQPGSFAKYAGTIWHPLLPGRKEITFELKLSTIETALADGPANRWIEVQVVTQAPGGNYTETAWLLVDTEQYESAQELHVGQGWIVADSPRIGARLAYYFPEQGLRRLVVPFDDSDALKTAADERGIRLPAERVSVQDALVLLFGAPIPTAPEPVRRLRAQLAADSRRISSKRTIEGPRGPLNCAVYSSDEGRLGVPATKLLKLFGIEVSSEKAVQVPPPDSTYVICRDENVPFSFAQMDVTSPIFRAHCKLSGYDESGRASVVDQQGLARDANLLDRKSVV